MILNHQKTQQMMRKTCHFKTAREFFNSVEDKESYYWRTSGKHTYSTMIKFEKGLIKSKKKK